MSFTSKLKWFNDEERPWVFDPLDSYDGSKPRRITDWKPRVDTDELMDMTWALPPVVGAGGKAALGAKSFASFGKKKAAKQAKISAQKEGAKKFRAETEKIGKQTEKTNRANNAMEKGNKTRKTQERRQQTKDLRESTRKEAQQNRRSTDKPSARSQETAKIVYDLAAKSKQKSFAAFKSRQGGMR